MDATWISYATAIGSIITPILVLILAGIGWLIKAGIEVERQKETKELERIKELEDKLRNDRIEIYNALLEPFFILFTSDAAFSQDPKYKGKKKDELSIGKMLTVDYRKVGFKLSLLADDSVVRSYNQLMQFFYHAEANSDELEIKTSHWIKLLGDLLLEIRKSMGNQATELSNWEMLEWFMSDIKIMRENYQKS
jgi:hypothetical protein